MFLIGQSYGLRLRSTLLRRPFPCTPISLSPSSARTHTYTRVHSPPRHPVFPEVTLVTFFVFFRCRMSRSQNRYPRLYLRLNPRGIRVQICENSKIAICIIFRYEPNQKKSMSKDLRKNCIPSDIIYILLCICVFYLCIYVFLLCID